jgi:hypothetical protein
MIAAVKGWGVDTPARGQSITVVSPSGQRFSVPAGKPKAVEFARHSYDGFSAQAGQHLGLLKLSMSFPEFAKRVALECAAAIAEGNAQARGAAAPTFFNAADEARLGPLLLLVELVHIHGIHWNDVSVPPQN